MAGTATSFNVMHASTLFVFVPSAECESAPGCAVCACSSAAQPEAARSVKLAPGRSPARPAACAFPSPRSAGNGSGGMQNTESHTANWVEH